MAQQAAGLSLRVLTSAAAGGGRGEQLAVACGRYITDFGVPTFYGRVSLGEDLSLQLVRELPSSLRWADLVHVNALWSPSSLLTLSLCLSPRSPLRRPLVLSPRGALLPWALSQRAARKQSLLRVLRPLLQRVDGWHATSEEEAHAVQRLRLVGPGATLAVVGNAALPVGADAVLSPREQALIDAVAALPSPRVMTLGRVHPVKNLELAIDGLARLRRLPGQQQGSLLIVGPERASPDSASDRSDAVTRPDSYGQRLRDQAAALGLADCVQLLGLQQGAVKDRLLALADVLWLPSHMESFGNVVVEALAAGTPVVAAQTTPWRDLEAHRVGRWVAPDPAAFAQATAGLLALRPRPDWATHCRAIADAHYTWAARQSELGRLYDAVLGRVTSAAPSARP